MDETYLLAAARYVEMNPVKARLSERAEEYPWSSAHAHIEGIDDKLLKSKPLLVMVADWKLFLGAPSEDEIELLRRHERTGRPLGQESFVENLESAMSRLLRPQKRGPKKRGSI